MKEIKAFIKPHKLSAVALVPLTLWFVWSVARYAGAPYGEVLAFLESPFNATAMLLFVIAGLRDVREKRPCSVLKGGFRHNILMCSIPFPFGLL